MEFIKGAVTESGTNTFTETTIPTPVSRSEKLAMLVWSVDMLLPPFHSVDAAEVSGEVQLTRESKDAILEFEHDDVIVKAHVIASQSSQGSLTEYADRSVLSPGNYRFAPPFLYTKANMFLGIKSTAETVVRSAAVKVGYTLETVPTEIFIAALVE